jgi:hypothetical protein
VRKLGGGVGRKGLRLHGLRRRCRCSRRFRLRNVFFFFFFFSVCIVVQR